MKILCRLKFTAKEAGARDNDPEKTPEQIVKEWHEKWPHLRFCKRLHGWVYKKRCTRCFECIEVIEE